MKRIKEWLALFFGDFLGAWLHSLIYGGAIGILCLFALSALFPLIALAGLLDWIWDDCIRIAIQERPFAVLCLLVLYSVLHCFVAWYVERDEINQPKQKDQQDEPYPYMEFTMLELDVLLWTFSLFFAYILLPNT